MNNTEAKFILAAYRPGGRDASDPAFDAALAQAKADPALGAWFARSQEHDATVAAKLRTITPPAGLREAILAGGRVTGGHSASQAETTKRAFWKQWTWLAAAAAIAILAALSRPYWPKHGVADAPLTDFALTDALEPQKHGGHGEANGAWQALLSQSSTHLASGALPVDFAALRSTGCRTVSVAGHDVLEVCFKRDGSWFHCYVARVEDFPGAPDKAAPSFAASGKMVAAMWADGKHRYVVAGSAGRPALERLL